MPLLMPCPRCTQSLPVSAGFCRRCGLNLTGMTRPFPSPASGGGKLWKLGALAAVGLAAMVVVGALGIFAIASGGVQATPAQPVPTLTYRNVVAVPSSVPPTVTYPFGIPAGGYSIAAPRFSPPIVKMPAMPTMPRQMGYPPSRIYTPGYSPGAVVPGAGQVYAQQIPHRR